MNAPSVFAKVRDHETGKVIIVRRNPSPDKAFKDGEVHRLVYWRPAADLGTYYQPACDEAAWWERGDISDGDDYLAPRTREPAPLCATCFDGTEMAR